MYNHQLDTFVKVVECGSFNAAAQQLYISPNAVLKQINLLEERAGVKLFERTPKGITLTDAGNSFYKDSLYIIDYCHQSLRRAQLSEHHDCTLKIGTSLTTPVTYLMNVWPEIQQQVPMNFELVSFENTPKNAQEIMKHFGLNIDLVLGVYDENMLKNRNCQAYHLMDLPICIMVPYDHPFAFKDQVEIEDLKGQTVLLLEEHYIQCFDEIRKYLNTQDIQIHDVEFLDINAFNQCVNHKEIFIGIDQWKNVHPLLKMIPVNWNFKAPYGVLYSNKPSMKVELFINSLKSIL